MPPFERVPQPDVYLAAALPTPGLARGSGSARSSTTATFPHHNPRDHEDYEWGIEGAQLVELPDGRVLLNATCFLPTGQRGSRQRVFFCRCRSRGRPLPHAGSGAGPAMPGRKRPFDRADRQQRTGAFLPEPRSDDEPSLALRHRPLQSRYCKGQRDRLTPPPANHPIAPCAKNSQGHLPFRLQKNPELLHVRPVRPLSKPCRKNRAGHGGASGIGEEIVRAFAQQGSRVGFLDLDREASARLADELGGDVAYEICDLRDIAR